MMHVESNAINVCMAHIGNGFFKCRIVQGLSTLYQVTKKEFTGIQRGGIGFCTLLVNIICHVFLFLFLKKKLVHK
jgi:hypothetical protein